MDYAVSVIVPVYNVAPYIEKCARSLFEQTLGRLEIIFVDDCSPDNSVEIIEKCLEDYPHRKQSTKILKISSNTGQAGVRRYGLLEATGSFIIHCDGDDWVDHDLYRAMYTMAVDTGADVVVCDEVQEYKKGRAVLRTPALPYDGKELMATWYRCTLGLFCHNKLVKRSLYTDNGILPWPGLNMWEDNGLFARLFYFARNIKQIHSDTFYHYNRANAGAMTAGYGLKQVEQMLGIASNLESFFKRQPDGARFDATVNAFKYLARINLVTDSFTNYRRFRRTFPESRAIAGRLDIEAFSRKGRIRFRMVRMGLAPLFVIMFKGLNTIKKMRSKLSL